jgi:hypothetical protein
MTAFHSAKLKGVMANSSYHPMNDMKQRHDIPLTEKNGMYNIAKCRTMLKVMAATRNGFSQTGRASRLSFSEREFMALNISTVTRIDKLMVVADRDI